MKISEITKVVTGGTPSTKNSSYWDNGTIPWLQSGVCKNTTVKTYSKLITKEGLNNSSAKMMPPNTVLIALTGATVGKVALLPFEACANQSVTGILPNNNFLPKFLFYQLMSLRSKIIHESYGDAQPHVSQQYIKDIDIYLPPLAEQERIVNKLEEQLSQLDSGVESLKKAKKQLELYRQAVLKEAFEKCKKSFALESVCEHITDGDHMPPPKAPKGIPFIMISNVDKNIIDWSKTAFVGEEYFNNIDIKRKPQKGDVLYTVTGSFGIPILINFEKDFCFQRHIALLRPNDKVLQKFLYYVLLHPNVYKQAKEKATGTAQKTVGLGVLRKIIIPFTEDKTTQNSIVDEIDSKLSICDSIEQSIEKSLQQSEALRQSILRESFVPNFSR